MICLLSNWNAKFLPLVISIIQLILATLPDPKNGKQPSIITEDNFQLLFEIQKKVLVLGATFQKAFWYLSIKLNYL